MVIIFESGISADSSEASSSSESFVRADDILLFTISLTNEEKARLTAEIDRNREEIKKARFDHTYSDREYAKTLTEEVHKEYEPLLKAAESDPQKLAEVKRAYKNALHIAKNTKLITKIQMIFQDPIASLNPRMTVREIIAEGLVINGIKDKEYIENFGYIAYDINKSEKIIYVMSSDNFHSYHREY